MASEIKPYPLAAFWEDPMACLLSPYLLYGYLCPEFPMNDSVPLWSCSIATRSHSKFPPSSALFVPPPPPARLLSPLVTTHAPLSPTLTLAIQHHQPFVTSLSLKGSSPSSIYTILKMHSLKDSHLTLLFCWSFSYCPLFFFF